MAVFLEQIKQQGYLDDLHVVMCNVGSRKISTSDDYGSAGWNAFAPNLSIYGFDADNDACEAANADLEARGVNWHEKHSPFVLSDKEGDCTFYVTKDPMCSSLYPPNEEYLERFKDLAEYSNLDFTVGLETITLDRFCQMESLSRIDFLQVDAQGADLLVLHGAQDVLAKSIFIIQVEVIFSYLYKDQPLFADVDAFLRQQGFTLFDLNCAYRTRKISPIRSSHRHGQILWGDAFYIRDLLGNEVDPTFKTPQNLLKLACMADVLNFPDYTLEILVHLTQDQETAAHYNFADAIATVLAQQPQLVANGLANIPAIQAVQEFLSQGILQQLETSSTATDVKTPS